MVNFVCQVFLQKTNGAARKLFRRRARGALQRLERYVIIFNQIKHMRVCGHVPYHQRYLRSQHRRRDAPASDDAVAWRREIRYRLGGDALVLRSLLHIAFDKTQEALLQVYRNDEYANWDEITRFWEYGIRCETINEAYINSVKWSNSGATTALTRPPGAKKQSAQGACAVPASFRCESLSTDRQERD